MLKPVLTAGAHGQLVTGVELGLTTLGAGPAELAKGETKPARLIFSGAFLKKARDEAKAPPAPKEFASIAGTIALSGKPLQAIKRIETARGPVATPLKAAHATASVLVVSNALRRARPSVPPTW